MAATARVHTAPGSSKKANNWTLYPGVDSLGQEMGEQEMGDLPAAPKKDSAWAGMSMYAMGVRQRSLLATEHPVSALSWMPPALAKGISDIREKLHTFGRRPIDPTGRESGRPVSYSVASNRDALRLQSLLIKRWRYYYELRVGLVVARSQLVDRLELELRMIRGFRMIILASILFTILIMLGLPRAGGVSAGVQAEFGLLNTYNKMLGLEEVEGIKTSGGLLTFMTSLMENSRSMQVLSDVYFQEAEGEMRIASGIHEYSETESINMETIRPRIDSEAFTITAWVQTQPVSWDGAYVLRKPLGKTFRTHDLSCWAWFVGDTPRFDYGAHDYSPAGEGDGAQQVSIELSAEDGALPDGRRRWSHAVGTAPKLHFEAIVVSETNISFYQDAQLVATRPLPRAVTDCASSILEIGCAGSRLGDVTIYPRGLLQEELEEIVVYGNTLAHISSGRRVFAPAVSPIDRQAARTSAQAAAMLDSLALNRELLESEQVLTRAQNDPPPPEEPAPRLETNVSAGCSSTWPSCRVLPAVNQTLTADTLLVTRSYYPLTPPEPATLFASAAPLDWASALHYDPPSFPSWRGTSVTFSAWVKVGTSGYLLTKSPRYDAPARCWTFHIERNGLATIGGATVDGFTAPYKTVYLPPDAGFSFSAMSGFRHVAMVFDVARDSLQAYVDGSSLGEAFFGAGEVGQLDCDVSATTYIGLGHRAPGASPLVGEVADLRMYVGQALNASEVHQLAFAPGSPRSCTTDAEHVQDAEGFRDVQGHGCAWYQEHRLQWPKICRASAVQAACPIACGLIHPCVAESSAAAAPVYTLYRRIQKLLPQPAGMLCPRVGLDLPAQCRHWRASNQSGSQSSFWGFRDFDSYSAYLRSESRSPMPNVTDCELVERISDRFCAFPGALPPAFDAQVNAGKGFTVRLWLRAVEGLPSLDDAGRFAPTVALYSSIAPVVPLVVFYTRASGLLFADFFGRCATDEFQNAALSIGSLDSSEWTFVAFTYDAAAGLIRLSINGATAEDSVNWPEWCAAPSGGFIEAASFSHAMLVSGIQVTPTALSNMAVTQAFYSERSQYALRPGPFRTNKARLTDLIAYEQTLYTAPAFLVAPPLVRIHQGTAQAVCEAASFGRVVHDGIRMVANTTRCQHPYACAEGMEDPTALLSCSSEAMPKTHLGRGPVPASANYFTEFLSSITEASMLVREGEGYNTADFLTRQTRALEITLVAFATQYGISSEIRIEAEMGAQVSMRTWVNHYRSMHAAEALDELTQLEVIGYLAVVLTLADIAKRTKSRLKRGNFRSFDTHAGLLVFDVIALVVIPIVYLALVAGHGYQSDYWGLQLTSSLASVPWADTNVEWEKKTKDFFSGLELIRKLVNEQLAISVLGFSTCIMILVRMIVATAAHPRIAMLVSTVVGSLDDLGHLAFIVIVVFAGFTLLGYSQFGGMSQYFSTLANTFEVLWEMSVEGASSDAMRGGAQRKWYMLLFAFFVFFLAINVIIAIVVESFLKVKRHVEALQAEFDFFTDCAIVLKGDVRQKWEKWPQKGQIVEALSRSGKHYVTPSDIQVLLPHVQYHKLRSFFMFYSVRRFPFMAPENNPYIEEALRLPQAVNEIESRVAWLLEKQPSTPLDRLDRLAAVGPSSKRHPYHHHQRMKRMPPTRSGPPTSPSSQRSSQRSTPQVSTTV